MVELLSTAPLPDGQRNPATKEFEKNQDLGMAESGNFLAFNKYFDPLKLRSRNASILAFIYN
jgi:hypothetical protein